jgi:hypothetical protein
MSSQRVVGLVLRVWIFGCACLAGGALATGGSVRTLDEFSCDQTRGAAPAPCEVGDSIKNNPCSDKLLNCKGKAKADCTGKCTGCKSTNNETKCDWFATTKTYLCIQNPVAGGCGEYFGVAGDDTINPACTWNGDDCVCNYVSTDGTPCQQHVSSLDMKKACTRPK